MRAEHQPTIFPRDKFSVGLSNAADGNMRHWLQEDETEVKQNRQRFIERCGGKWDETNNVVFSADGDDFLRYKEAPQDERGISLERSYKTTSPVDGLYVRQPGRGLFLTVGDCGPIAIVNTALVHAALIHVGRHSAEQHGARESVEMLRRELGWNLKDILVWVGPAVGKETYPLHLFAGKSLHEVIVEQLREAGLEEKQIEVCDVDTAKSREYYSHSEHLAGRASRNGRFAVYVGLHPAPDDLLH